MTKYNQETEQIMLLFYEQLLEKDKRHYASQEAKKLGHGGIKYLGQLLGISQRTIQKGNRELQNPKLYAEIPKGKQRRLGGGRKKKEEEQPKVAVLLRAFIEEHKGGSPTDSKVYWIHLKPKEIALRFEAKHHIEISNGFAKRMLKEMNFKYRKMSKNIATGHYKNRNLQFEIIFELIAIMSSDSPIISIDCKKKERLGNLYRAGKCYSTDLIKVYDHDYHYLSEGAVVPHGIYDLGRNTGYISIGNSHETAEFIHDNILWWWDNFGIHHYPSAQSLLILCDSGGANSYRHHAFKKQILLLAQKIGIDIIICHYPPYASKWNPIEHRLFCHVHNSIQGVVFSDYNIVKELMDKTTTTAGLKIVVRLNLKNYPIGIKTSKDEVDFTRIQFNKKIPELSYRIAV
jgi:hypothetical protein